MTALQTWVSQLTTLALRLLQQLLRLLSVGFAWKLGSCFGWACSFVFLGYRHLVQKNLLRAFGDDLDARERRVLCGQVFRHLGGNVVSSLQLPVLSAEKILAQVEVCGREHLVCACKEQRGVILVLAHQSCWEVLTQTKEFIPQGVTSAAIYQPIRNSFLNRLIKQQRERFGTVLFDRSKGFFEPLRLLRKGGVLGVLADQHAGDAGTWLPFFGRLASTTTLPALLAKRSKSILLPVEVCTQKAGKWKISIGSPIDTKTDSRSVEELSCQLAKQLEESIRAHPADWFWVHQRWKTPLPKFLWSQAEKEQGELEKKQEEVSVPFRLLVRSPNWLGDACMAIPMVRALKQGRPQLELTVLCAQNLAPFWQRMDGVDQVLTFEKKDSPLRVGKKIRQAGLFDAGILCPNSPRSVLEMLFGHVAPRIGTKDQLLRRLLIDASPEKPPLGPVRHHVESYLDLARLVGASCQNPQFFQAPKRANQAELTTVGIVAGAEYGPAKRWPTKYYAETIDLLLERYPQIEVCLFGTPKEAAIGEEIMRRCTHADTGKRLVNRIGATCLDGLMDELIQCRVLLSNDTGGMHLAAALGVQVVAIFGSTEPAWTRPLGKQHRILRKHVACSPCFLRECPLDLRCMHEIEPSQVIEELASVLSA